MKKKLYITIFLVLIVFIGYMLYRNGLFNADEGIRLQVYETDFKGNPMNTYPNKLLTDNKLFLTITEHRSENKIDVEKLEVLYLVKFYDESNEVNTLMIMNNGQISLMKIGLKFGEYVVTEEGLQKIIKILET